MAWYLIKILLTSIIIVAVSEIGKFNSFIGSLLASIPLVSVLGMIWMYQEGISTTKITSHSTGVFWMVLPSLPMFLLLPWLLEKQGWTFYSSLTLSLSVTILLYFLTAL
ncbi:MAG: DUF3147 family protein, partial [Candidatus Paceibacterota bacterium]